MKPDDSNLTVEEYIKYFADENATRFFNELINEVNSAQNKIKKLEKQLEDFDNLQYNFDDLSSKHWSQEVRIEELEEEIQILQNDIIRIKGE